MRGMFKRKLKDFAELLKAQGKQHTLLDRLKDNDRGEGDEENVVRLTEIKFNNSLEEEEISFMPEAGVERSYCLVPRAQ